MLLLFLSSWKKKKNKPGGDLGWAPGAAGRLERVPSPPMSLGRATFWGTTLQLLFVRCRFPNKGLVSYWFDPDAGGRCEAKSQLALVPAGRGGLEEELLPSGADGAWLSALPPSPCTSPPCPWVNWCGPGSLSKMKNGLCRGHPVSSGQLRRLKPLCCLPVPSHPYPRPTATPIPFPIPVPSPFPSHPIPTTSLPSPQYPQGPGPLPALSHPQTRTRGRGRCPRGAPGAPLPAPGCAAAPGGAESGGGRGSPTAGQEAERAGGARFPPSLPPHSRRWGRGGEQGWRPPAGAAGRSPPPPPRRR